MKINVSEKTYYHKQYLSIIGNFIVEIAILVTSVCFATVSHSAVENLDEMIARKARLSNVSWGSSLLEGSSPAYIWQPETLQYTDVTTNNEVWKFTNTPSGPNMTMDISTSHWSANGNRVMFHSLRNSPQINNRGGLVNYNGVSYRCIASNTNQPPPNATYWQPIYYDASLPTWSSTKGYESALKIWMVSNTDGAKLRPAKGAASQLPASDGYINWSPILSDVFYQMGQTWTESGTANLFYKHSINDTTISKNVFLTLPPIVTSSLGKKAISGDGSRFLVGSGSLFFPLTLYPEANKSIDSANGYTAQLNFDYFWGGALSPWRGYHEQFTTGAANGVDGIWTILMPTNNDYPGPWWRARLTGTGANGAPVHASDQVAPYNWGGEVEPVNTATDKANQRNPWCGTGELSTASNQLGTPPIVVGNRCIDASAHGVPDRWARYFLGSKSDESPGGVGHSFLDMRNKGYSLILSSLGGVHYDWSGWTDWPIASDYDPIDSGPTSPRQIVAFKMAANSLKPLALSHQFYNQTANPSYDVNSRPTQSPDGTKAMFHSSFLNSNDNDIQLFWTVAYYPYPPEIKSAAKNGSNVRLTWDFNQGSSCSTNSQTTPRTGPTPNFSTPRTYATRGWPHESLDCSPSPREIKQFRVWSSPDNVAWSPEGFAAYNNCNGTNECGMWAETAWTYDYAQANSSTRYYAVTSQEHSGLESRTLSNVWKVVTDGAGNITSQVQYVAYPANPGGKTVFYTAAPPAIAYEYTHKAAPATANGQYLVSWDAPLEAQPLIRYYNIYAKDGAPPLTDTMPLSDRQKSRIASIPASSDYVIIGNTKNYKYIDWLGNPDGSTQYFVTAVDYWGNETKHITTPKRGNPPK